MLPDCFHEKRRQDNSLENTLVHSGPDPKRELPSVPYYSWSMTLPGCLILFPIRRYEKIYRELFAEDTNEISALTGCLMPCVYKKYVQIGRRTTTGLVDKDNYIFNLWANSDDTFMKTEEYIYPWPSLVADFGGTLGLFLGFSFMTLWEGVLWATNALKAIQKGSGLSV